MKAKVISSILLSFTLACLVYFFNESLFAGLNPYLFAAYVAILLIITTVNVLLIIRQKVHSKKMVMIVVLILSLLSSMIISRVYIPSGNNHGTPRQYEETL